MGKGCSDGNFCLDKAAVKSTLFKMVRQNFKVLFHPCPQAQ